MLPVSEGAIAQLGERLLCKQEVVGSIPSGSTRPAENQPQCGGSNVDSSKSFESFRISCGFCPAICVLSDIVKRRSLRDRALVKAKPVRILHAPHGVTHVPIAKIGCGDA